MPARAAADRQNNPPHTSRGELKRQRIIVAASEMLAHRGYAGTTLDDIAKAAGTQAGSLYYYFASREELAEEVLTSGARDTMRYTMDAVAALPPGTSARTRLETAIMAHVTFTLGRSLAALAASRTIGQLPPEVESKVNKVFRAYGVFIAELFQAAAAEGAIAADVDLSAARMLVVGAANWTAEWFHPGGTSNPDEVGRLLCRLLFEGIGTGPQETGPATGKAARGRRRRDGAGEA